MYTWVTKDTLAGTGAASIHTFPSLSQLLSLGCGQRAPSYILISSPNWVTGSGSGMRVAVTCRQFQRPHLPPSLCRTTCNGVLREATADFTLQGKQKPFFSCPSDLRGPFPALYKKTLKSRLFKMDKDAAGRACVGLTLLPHPDWQTLKKTNTNISVYGPDAMQTPLKQPRKARHSLTVRL